MLEKDEFFIAKQLYRQAFRTPGTMEERFKNLRDYYFEVTGFYESEPGAIMHHATDLIGPDCEQCGKPLRTHMATFCAACGNKRVS